MTCSPIFLCQNVIDTIFYPFHILTKSLDKANFCTEIYTECCRILRYLVIKYTRISLDIICLFRNAWHKELYYPGDGEVMLAVAQWATTFWLSKASIVLRAMGVASVVSLSQSQYYGQSIFHRTHDRYINCSRNTFMLHSVRKQINSILCFMYMRSYRKMGLRKTRHRC